MKDYSFIRLSDTLTASQDLGDSPTVTHPTYETIQLLPNKTYLQITNFDGGISLDSDCEVFVIDCCDNVLADITDNVFIEEFTDTNGNNQCSIEYVNLGVDFYRQTVQIKFDMLSSDAVYYSNPLNITAYQQEKTVYFKYKNDDDFYGIGYTNANKWQSISLGAFFDVDLDETETENYFQISSENTISTRALVKTPERYITEKLNKFTFIRLNILLKHEQIYLDGVRVTDKPVIAGDDRKGDTNYIETDFTVNKDYNDTSLYDFQIFTGLQLTDFSPQGIYATGLTISSLSAKANAPLVLNTGQARVYNDSDVLIDTFDETDMIVSDNTLRIATSGSAVENLPNDSYYVNLSAGIVSGLGILNDGIVDNSAWTFHLLDGEYEVSEYNNNDYLVGTPSIDSFLSLYYKFNETSGTTATDDSGNGLDGTITNAVINQTGLVDKCYSFNSGGATNHYIDVPDNDALSFVGATTDTSFSISLWINPVNNFGAILNKFNAVDGYEYRLFIQSGILQFYIYSENNSFNRMGIADGNINLSQWNHIAITWDGVTLKMKVNNVDSSFSQVEFGTYVKMNNTSSILRIGQESDSDSGANRFEGLIDVLKIYKNYVLSDDEIEIEYNSGNGLET